MRKLQNYIFLFLILFFPLPKIVSAHSFGIIYNLPVPFWIYLYGGVVTMLASFLLIGYFFNKETSRQAENSNSQHVKINLSEYRVVNYFSQNYFLKILKIISIFFFLLTILAGALGENSSFLNINMNLFWIIFVLGLTYLSALLGDIYNFINPWKILTGWLIGKNEAPWIIYPKWLGYYPALLFYFIFIWIELIGQNTPFKLSIILILYTILNDLGVLLVGEKNWFKYCEFFSVFFKTISRISPIEYRAQEIHFRSPLIQLTKEKAEHSSLLIFILFMLSSTAFDGFKETIVFSKFYWTHVDNILRPIFSTNSYHIFETIILLISPFIFLTIYLFLIQLTKIIAKSSTPLNNLALQFIFSMIPIALVYNIAHYYTLIFTEGPNIFRLISDPFGFGWNLFHTVDKTFGIILDASFVWHSQVAFILIGHILSVYLTHIVALNIFTYKKRAFWSQFPMLILMIIYTMVGLWILSQPLTNGVS